MMKKIVLAGICMFTYMFADITAVQKPLPFTSPPVSTQPIVKPPIGFPIPEHPIVRPPLRPIRPVHPVVVYEDYNYYTEVVTSCDEYIRIIEEKDQEIARLEREIERLKNKEQVKLQNKLQTEYQKELKKFDDRASGGKSNNSLKVSDK